MTTATTRTTVRAYHRARFQGDVPAAARTLGEPFHLTDGRIDTIRLIFDATPWHAIMQAVTPS